MNYFNNDELKESEELMGMMKRLLDEDTGDEQWRVLPVIDGDTVSTHRLMEHIGKGRWVERKRGTARAMNKQCSLNIKEGYKTPLNQTERTELAAYSVLNRMRLV